MKVYLVREGYFFTNWEVDTRKVFKTKKALHEYMREQNGGWCYRSRKSVYGKHEEIYENQIEEVGYEIIESELV